MTSAWKRCAVLKTFRREYVGHSTFVTIAGETIESTLLHPYWVLSGVGLTDRPRRDHLPGVPDGATTRGRWVDAGDLCVGDVLLLRDGRMVPIDAVRSGPYTGTVYNFAVDGLECYAVGRAGVLVHNTNGAELGALIKTVARSGGSATEKVNALMAGAAKIANITFKRVADIPGAAAVFEGAAAVEGGVRPLLVVLSDGRVFRGATSALVRDPSGATSGLRIMLNRLQEVP